MTPSSAVSFGRAGFAAHMDKVGLQAVAQDLLQAAQQRPRSYAAPAASAPAPAPSAVPPVYGGADQGQQGTVTASPGAMAQDGAGGTVAAPAALGPAASHPSSTSPVGAVGAYAARERAVVDCFVAMVQQAAASCTQTQQQLAQQQPSQPTYPVQQQQQQQPPPQQQRQQQQ